jgi:hypothetical protein
MFHGFSYLFIQCSVHDLVRQTITLSPSTKIARLLLAVIIDWHLEVGALIGQFGPDIVRSGNV